MWSNLPMRSQIFKSEKLKDIDYYKDKINKIKLLVENIRAFLYEHKLIKASMRTDFILPRKVPPAKFTVYNPSKSDWKQNTIDDEISIYTDGSKLKTGVGAGIYYIYEKNIFEYSYKLPDYCDSYQAEVLAIIKGAEEIKSKEIKNRNVSIYTDCKSALKNINNSVVLYTRLELKCRNILQEISCHNTVRLVYVPSHSKIKGNEKADKIAKVGANSTDKPIENVRMPISTKRGTFFGCGKCLLCSEKVEQTNEVSHISTCGKKSREIKNIFEML